jgi:hypothetical protein
MSLAKSFAKFNVNLKNPRQSWSARSNDGTTVVITLWRPGLKGKPFRYVSHSGTDSEITWTDTFGNRERLENLIWAEEHCGGCFRAVVIVPKDETAGKWEIAKSWPIESVMRITSLNRKNGEFNAELA